MTTNDIMPNAVYLSIHAVPYRVLGLIGDDVIAICEDGRNNKSFQMPIERFAETMHPLFGRGMGQ